MFFLKQKFTFNLKVFFYNVSLVVLKFENFYWIFKGRACILQARFLRHLNAWIPLDPKKLNEQSLLNKTYWKRKLDIVSLKWSFSH